MSLAQLLLALGDLGPNLVPDYSSHAEGLLQQHPARLQAVPISDRTGGPYGHLSHAGTDVEVQLRFYKVFSANVAEGLMALKVWLRLEWYDERLAWDPAEHGNVTYVHMTAGDPTAVSQIWVPELTLYNAGTSNFRSSFEPQLAFVSHTGHVFWSRPGTVEVMCKFGGLIAFPYDELTCKMDLGGWIQSAYHQGLKPRACPEGADPRLCGDGWIISRAEETSGESYQENGIASVNMTQKNMYYPCCPDEAYPILTCVPPNLFNHRAAGPSGMRARSLDFEAIVLGSHTQMTLRSRAQPSTTTRCTSSRRCTEALLNARGRNSVSGCRLRVL